ncbi:MAG: GNAT family N-acetyltransferase [Anaerolineaceae bacterium]|jgi:ribosomal-protein-alanine N-acetyltransferase|nr:GNAT family N-acetyltransferase [Anaerolineaceae bacterium]
MSSHPPPGAGEATAEPQILRASLSDLAAERRLEKVCFPREDVWPLVESLWVLIKPGMVRLKMVSSGEMLGFLSGYEQLSGKVGWISSIGITPAWQGRGLGARLLAAGERALGTPLVRLTVRASNLRAIHLYEQSGYRQIKTVRGYYVGGEDGLVFEKDTRLSQAF